MTVETRLAYPEGATECPPDGKGVHLSPTCSSSASSSNNNKSLSSSSSSTTTSRRFRLRQSKRIISNAKRNSLRSHQSQQPLQVVVKVAVVKKESDSGSGDKADESSTSVTDDANTADEMLKVVTGGDSGGGEKSEDLNKKSPKTKGNGESSKEDMAASRKSMRLRLRRADDIPIPKDRPRHVEDLINIDFGDQATKILFMDTLGMSLRTTLTTKTEPDETESTLVFQNLPGNDDPAEGSNEEGISLKAAPNIEGPKESDLERLVGTKNSSLESDDGEKASQSSHQCLTSGDLSSSATMEVSPASPPTPPTPTVTLIRHLDGGPTDDSEDEGGWENWVEQVPQQYLARQEGKEKPAATEKEINECLNRLIQLGTGVVRCNDTNTG